jgi:hypothetical protein
MKPIRVLVLLLLGSCAHSSHGGGPWPTSWVVIHPNINALQLVGYVPAGDAQRSVEIVGSWKYSRTSPCMGPTGREGAGGGRTYAAFVVVRDSAGGQTVQTVRYPGQPVAIDASTSVSVSVHLDDDTFEDNVECTPLRARIR